MSDRLAGGIKVGATSYGHTFKLLSLTDGSPVTGKVAADLTATYRRQGATRQTISLSNLAALDSAWSSGGVKEDANGDYRIDLPDAMFVTGVDWVSLHVVCAGAYVFSERIPLETKGAAEVFTLATTTNGTVNTINSNVSALPSAAANATAVWNAGTRQLTAFGFTVSLATSVWEELSASHLTAGTTGAKLASAASAADPWSTVVGGGAYGAGEAGTLLAALGGDHALIVNIDAKTQQLTFTTPNVVDASASGGVTPAAVAAAVLNTVMAESYAADGAQATLSQALYLIMQSIIERSMSGTTMIIKKLDGTTTAATLTTNSATNPTAVTRTA